MPIDFAHVDWLHVAILAMFAFVATASGQSAVVRPMGLGLDSGAAIRGNIRVLDLLSALALTSDADGRPEVYTCEGDDSRPNRPRRAAAAQPGERHHASPISKGLSKTRSVTGGMWGKDEWIAQKNGSQRPITLHRLSLIGACKCAKRTTFSLSSPNSQ